MATRISIEIDEHDLRRLVLDHLSRLVDTPLTEADITIEVKTKQNYRAEWESGAFRATIHKLTP